MLRNALSAATILVALLAAPESTSARTCESGTAWSSAPDAELISLREEFACLAERTIISLELAARLDRGELDDDLDAGALKYLRVGVVVDGLRHSLLRGDRADIDAAMQAIETLTHRRDVDPAGEDDPRVERAVQEMMQDFAPRYAGIRDILDGRVAPPATPARFDALPDWTLQFGFCGTPMLMFWHDTTDFPETEDAWIAVGREDLAVSSLLQRQWVEAMQLGTTPPRLREYGERMFGIDGYRREVESALAGIRIDDTPTGRTAFIPLLGQWLPLPTAIQSYDQEQPQRFDSPEALAEWLRPMLLGREEDAAD